MAGEFSAMMQGHILRVSSGLRRAVETTGRQVQAEARAQARAAGFKDGGRAIANAWRLKVYPDAAGAVTFKPAAVIRNRMTAAVEAFDRGAQITAGGRRFLAFPTGYNATGGRVKAGRKGGMRISPEQMASVSKKEKFVIHSKQNPNVWLWCLRLREATGLSRGRGKGRLKVFAGFNTEVLTGKAKGAALKKREALKQGFVPMFFLMKRVSLRRRLSVEALRQMGRGLLRANVILELNRK